MVRGMRKIGADIRYAVARLGEGSESARLNLRIQQVRERYRQAIESVYRDAAALHLAHTNNVIIKERKLVVYVDDSLFAAELNAQRELIKLRLLELFGEEIDDFQIRTSRWKKYREMHPYLTETQQEPDADSRSVPLDSNEKSYVSNTSSIIEDERLRKTFEKAMTADLEWKKGERVENLVDKRKRAL